MFSISEDTKTDIKGEYAIYIRKLFYNGVHVDNVQSFYPLSQARLDI